MSLETEEIAIREIIPSSKFGPFSVSEGLINKAKEGDQDAYTELDFAIRPRLLGYFYQRLPEEAEDLTQISMIKIASNLDKFHINLEGPLPVSRHPFPVRFTYWCFRIAKNTLYEGLRELAKRERNFVPSIPDGQNNSFDEIISHLAYNFSSSDPVFMDPTSMGEIDKQVDPGKQDNEVIEENSMCQLLNTWFDQNLIGRQRDVVAQKMVGKQNAEIAAEMNLHDTTVDKIICRARNKVVEELFSQANLSPLKSFRDDNIAGLGKEILSTAAMNGRLKVIKILGRVYTTPEFIREYLITRRDNLDKNQVIQGLVYIGEHTTYDEYNSLHSNYHYRKLLVRINGRYYIRPEDLEDIREKRSQRASQPAKILPTIQGYMNLKDVVKTNSEFSRCRAAILAGRLEAIKERRNFFVTTTAVAEYYEKYKNKHQK